MRVRARARVGVRGRDRDRIRDRVRDRVSAAQLRLLQPLRHVQGGRIVPARRAVLLLWLLVLRLLVLRLLVVLLLVMLLLVMLLLVLRLLVLRLLVLLRRLLTVLGSWRLPPRLACLNVAVVNPALLVLIRFPPRRKLMILGEDPRALEGVSTAAGVSAKASRMRRTRHRANSRRSRREACESQHARDLATNRHLQSRRRVG